MPHFVAMSSTEIQFIKLYVAAMRRNYFALQTVIDLMRPDNLNVASFYTAATIAVQMEHMADDFERRLFVWRKKHRPRLVNLAPTPSDDDLADLFSLSFFKLLQASPGAEKSAADASGWFSGNPDDWQNSVSSYTNVQSKKVAAELNAALSKCFSAFAKFFGQNTFFTSPNKPPNKWPVDNTDDFFFEFDDDGDDNFE